MRIRAQQRRFPTCSWRPGRTLLREIDASEKVDADSSSRSQVGGPQSMAGTDNAIITSPAGSNGGALRIPCELTQRTREYYETPGATRDGQPCGDMTRHFLKVPPDPAAIATLAPTLIWITP